MKKQKAIDLSQFPPKEKQEKINSNKKQNDPKIVFFLILLIIITILTAYFITKGGFKEKLLLDLPEKAEDYIPTE